MDDRLRHVRWTPLVHERAATYHELRKAGMREEAERAFLGIYLIRGLPTLAGRGYSIVAEPSGDPVKGRQ